MATSTNKDKNKQQVKTEIVKTLDKSRNYTFDDLVQIGNTNMTYNKIGKAKIFVEILDEERCIRVPAKIKDEHFLEFKYQKQKREVLIITQPKIDEEERGNRIARLILNAKRRLIWHVGARAEATHDPEKSQLDLVQITTSMRLTKVLIKSRVLEAIAKATPKQKTSTLEIILSIGVILMGLAMGYFLTNMAAGSPPI